MKALSKENSPIVIHTPSGEVITEIIGRAKETGTSTLHSLAHVLIPPGKSVTPHFHKMSEETYHFTKGKALMRVDGEEKEISAGTSVLIMPGQVHSLINHTHLDVEFYAISAPAWQPDDSYPSNHS
ncbi:MAG: cupin domain-containing protein [Deltaproteobacteria bacterium]|nr:cupin domain-containing protein [Deltaproteobacteria bacterium]